MCGELDLSGAGEWHQKSILRSFPAQLFPRPKLSGMIGWALNGRYRAGAQ